MQISIDSFRWIGETLWAGNVEIHVKADDWQKHGHVNDHAFDNTILHVVHEGVHEIKRKDNSIIPVLQLKNKQFNFISGYFH